MINHLQNRNQEFLLFNTHNLDKAVKKNLAKYYLVNEKEKEACINNEISLVSNATCNNNFICSSKSLMTESLKRSFL